MKSFFSRVSSFVALYKSVCGRFTKEIILLSFLGFLSGIAGSVGVTAVIPLLSFFVGGEGESDMFVGILLRVFRALPFFGITTLLVTIVLIFVVRAGLLFFFGYIRLKIRQEYRIETMGNLFEALAGARWTFLLRQKLGHLQNTLFRDVDVSSRFLETVGNIILAGTSIFVFGVFAVFISPTLTLLVFVLGAVLYPFSHLLMRKTRRTEEELFSYDRVVSQYVSEHMIGAKTIKGLGVADRVVSRARSHFRAWNIIALKKYALLSLGSVAAEPFSVLFVVIAFLLFYTTGSFRLETFTATILLIQRMFVYLQSIFGSWQALYEQMPHVEHVVAFGEALREEQEEDAGGLPFQFSRALEFRDVSLVYGRGEKILASFTVTIKKGEHIGLIGPSGAGKTSVADMLLRLIEPIEGSLVLDGIDARRFDIRDWRKHVGYVSQDMFLLNDTIQNNILFYRENIDDEKMRRAAEDASILDFISRLPEEFDTVVGERGVELSTGQRQRILLARALVGAPEILILDEATSALDRESEIAIQKTIEGLRGRVTVLTIAHRLSTVMGADRILVLDRGKIIEDGAPAALLRDRNSYFSRMRLVRERKKV